MIGWRPYLMTFLALAIAAAAILDVAATAHKSNSCSSADGQLKARDYVDARSEYAAVLEHAPKSACALSGVARSEDGLCVRDQRIAVTDTAEAHSQLIALAEATPPPGPKSCVWTQLRLLAARSTSKGGT